MADPDFENPILDSHLKAKIGKFLSVNGFQPIDDANAEFLLTFDYQAAARQEQYYEYVGASSAGVGIGTTHYIPTLRYVWSQRLKVKVCQGNSVIWTGKAEASKYYSDQRHAADYLVVALFSRFGEDTKKQEMITISDDDQRLIGIKSFSE
jgi:hypothetical protein